MALGTKAILGGGNGILSEKEDPKIMMDTDKKSPISISNFTTKEILEELMRRNENDTI